jgi:Coenzyme PQQ synthesis protein D (PqqD)
MTLRLRTGDLEWREIDDEIVLLDGRQATYLSTNGSGTLLWRALADGATREQLVSLLVDAYAIDERRATADADEFVALLASKGLLTE